MCGAAYDDLSAFDQVDVGLARLHVNIAAAAKYGANLPIRRVNTHRPFDGNRFTLDGADRVSGRRIIRHGGAQQAKQRTGHNSRSDARTKTAARPPYSRTHPESFAPRQAGGHQASILYDEDGSSRKYKPRNAGITGGDQSTLRHAAAQASVQTPRANSHYRGHRVQRDSHLGANASLRDTGPEKN